MTFEPSPPICYTPVIRAGCGQWGTVDIYTGIRNSSVGEGAHAMDWASVLAELSKAVPPPKGFIQNMAICHA